MGYAGLGAWQAESRVNRARAFSHYIHFRMREAYAQEKASAKGQVGQKDSYSDLMKKMGLKF